MSCAIGAALLRQGWTFETGPGKPVVAVKDGVRFNPRESLTRLAEEKMSDGRAAVAQRGVAIRRNFICK